MAEEKTIEINFEAETSPEKTQVSFKDYETFIESLRRINPIGKAHGHTGGDDGSQLDYNNLLNLPTIPSLSSVGTKTFTAGETLVEGDIVCLKPNYTDYYPSADAYVDQTNPTTNYGSTSDLRVGSQAGSGNAYLSYLKWDPTTWPDSTKIVKATFNIWESAQTGSALTETAEIVTSAWTEGAITFNTIPTIGAATASSGDTSTFTTTPTGLKTLAFTQLCRQWKAGGITNHGIKLSGGGAAGDTATFVSKDAGVGQKPYIRIWDSTTTDNKVYKAEARDYLLSRNLFGVVVAGGSADQEVTVRLFGISPELEPGTNYGFTYLGENGGTTFTADGLSRVIKLARPLTATESILDITTSNFPIESITSTYNGTFYTLAETKEAVLISNRGTISSGNYDYIVSRFSKEWGTAFSTGTGSNPQPGITFASNYITISLGGGSLTKVILIN